MAIHEAIRTQVVAVCETSSTEQLAAVVADDEGDTIFAIDRVSENVVIELFERQVASIAPIVLIAEGIAGGKIVLPSTASESDAVWRIIVDPIDGSERLERPLFGGGDDRVAYLVVPPKDRRQQPPRIRHGRRRDSGRREAAAVPPPWPRAACR